MKIRILPIIFAAVAFAAAASRADPLVSSWFTTESAMYARIYPTAAAESAGTGETTWTNGQQTQKLPAYSGIQEVDYSSSWLYVRSTGLALHVMGPWYLDAAHTQIFPNLPANTHTLTRFPRAASVPAAKTLTGLGAIGCFVDGVAMFDSRDGFVWNGTTEVMAGAGTSAGFWNRDAYVNESATFDPANAHQDPSGTYHYHANPSALRYELNDHVTYDAGTQTYSESTAAAAQHSPILGWVRDGCPVYGPYGYSSPMDSTSGVRRMISGYQLRNGQNGTDNLAVTGRATIPVWAQNLYGVSANQAGPGVSAAYPLGRYMEDNAYLGDLGKTLGVDFDLDQYNARYCVTPDYPNGTFAYFVSISSTGTPAFPYNIGRAYLGSPTGGPVTAFSETVTNAFTGGANAALVNYAPQTNASTGAVTVSWSSVEGGSYTVQASDDNDVTWSTLSSGLAATGITSYYQDAQASQHPNRAYRTLFSSLADYDDVSGHSALFSGEAALSNGVYYLQFRGSGSPLGYYSYLTSPYIYHFDLGFEYLIDADNSVSGSFLYDFTSGSFWYTDPTWFPIIYDFSLSQFIYYYADPNNPGHYTTSPRRFYNFATGQNFTK